MPPVFARRSTHTLGVGEAIALATAIDRLPPRLVVYGIAGQRFGLGEPLSPSVQSVLAEVASRVLAEAIRGAATRSNDGAGEEPADA
jgi:hydrogenase maturation protease